MPRRPEEEGLGRHVLGPAHLGHGLGVVRVGRGLAQVVLDHLRRPQRLGHDRRHRDPVGVALGRVGQGVEARVGHQLGWLGHHQHRVVDGQRGGRGLVEADPLVRGVVGRGVGDHVERRGLRSGANGRVDGDVRRVGQLLGHVGALELVGVAAVVCRHHARALGAVGRRAAADGHEAVALLVRVELEGVHDVVVLGVGLDLVVDGDGHPLALELALDVVDDAGALESGGHEQHVFESHGRGLGRGKLGGPPTRSAHGAAASARGSGPRTPCWYPPSTSLLVGELRSRSIVTFDPSARAPSPGPGAPERGFPGI